MRRRDLYLQGLLLAGIAPGLRAQKGFRPLFDGVSLRGWTRKARNPAQPSLGQWTVEDGVITGGQEVLLDHRPHGGIGGFYELSRLDVRIHG